MVEVADELEALLVRAERTADLARFYYLRLEHLRTGEARAGEKLRLWDRLGEVCVALGWTADAACAYEVAIELEPTSVARRHRLADLYIEAGGDQRDKAIAQHQAILRRNKRRLASYEALRALYRDTGQAAKADACADALAVIGMRPVEARRRATTPWPVDLEAEIPPLRHEDYQRLAMGDVDRMLSALFARVAPVFAIDRPRPRLARGAELAPDDGRLAMRALRQVAACLGVDAPVACLEPEQAATALVGLRQGRDRLVPVVTLGRAAAAAGADPRELVFGLARSLVDLRSDRFARLLCPRADELGQIVEFALALGRAGDVSAVADQGHTARWLATSLRPVDLDQVMIIGQRLAERDLDPARAALGWLEATERVGDRVGYLLSGHLGACVRILEREPSARANDHERILDLVWSSVTEAMFEVRERLEAWSSPAASHGEDHVA
jgi:golgin subfamily B member 1